MLCMPLSSHRLVICVLAQDQLPCPPDGDFSRHLLQHAASINTPKFIPGWSISPVISCQPHCCLGAMALRIGHVKRNSVMNEAGSNSASRAQQHSPAASERRVFSDGGEGWTQALPEPLNRPDPRLWDRWSCHCKYNDANVPLLKTLPTKGDSAWLEAERMEFSSLRPSTSWSAYPGCNPRCVNLWMHSPVRLRLITWSFKNSITQHPPRLSEVNFLQLAWIITLFDLPGELFVWFSP